LTDASTPVWFITGCSSGFGRELAQRIVQRGWRAIATARTVAQLADLAGSAGCKSNGRRLEQNRPDEGKGPSNEESE
jgi:NADP-dependent 3-hydroxy acid dehydrogenase YdfG